MGWAVVYAFNPKTQDTEAGWFLSLRPALQSEFQDSQLQRNLILIKTKTRNKQTTAWLNLQRNTVG